MQAMTPEDRLTRIENALITITEMQVRNDDQLGKLLQRAEVQDRVMDKHSAAIRDLIVVSRTILESQQTAVESQQKFQQKLSADFERMRNSTFEAIDRLTALIEKFLRGQHPNGNA